MRMPHFSPTAIASARATRRLLTRTSSGAPVGVSSVMIEPGRELGQAEPDPAELHGELERDVVEQGLERLGIEVVVFELFTHDLIPWSWMMVSICTASTPRHTTGLAHALSAPPM